MAKNTESGLGLIGVLLIIGVLLLTAGGVLVWQKKVSPMVTSPPAPAVLSPTPTTNPITPTLGTDFISWEEAKQLILNGKVEQAHELRDLTVALFLKDGTRRTTKEPKINAVFKFIDQCGKPCSDIMKAME